MLEDSDLLSSGILSGWHAPAVSGLVGISLREI